MAPSSGYQEIAGLRQRYRVVQPEDLLQSAGVTDPRVLTAWYDAGLDQALRSASGRREPWWTESIAVGSEAFVRHVAEPSKSRRKLEIREWANDAWYVRDPAEWYRRDGWTQA